LEEQMNKILDAEDILAGARNCVECVFMAASALSPREETDPLQAVADIASTKITEAIALLSEYRESVDAGPVPAAPDATPKSPAARTKRKGK
jgi:hypothetical protein